MKGEKAAREKRIAWVCLIIAGLVEFVWGYFMKQSHGFTVLLPAVIAIFFIIVSFFLLERGVRTFGIGMSYGIFTGLGIAGTTIIGIIALGESVSLMKILSLLVLMAGIIGIKFCDGREEAEKTAHEKGGQDK